jgi:ADP-dependent NAD(P)H-hydrate dehydratase / NAD(P)H-hydrate epimerase
MQKLYDEVNTLDKRCYEKFLLSEDLLMEHASNSMALHISKNHSSCKSILIVCGSGNNGADGLALARLLHTKFDVKVYLSSIVKSDIAILQLKRIEALGIKVLDELYEADIVVDCLFGTGMNKALDENTTNIINTLNSYSSIKIACDIPSGINKLGQIESIAFISDVTITMGALKTSLFTDAAKDYVGQIIVADLGIQRNLYETESNKYFLDESDMKLPFRDKKNSHKGSYGHLNVVTGCKKGAGIIAAKAAFGFGAGLVSVVCHENLELPYHIMQTHFISENCTAIAIGMGLGKYETEEIRRILSKKVSKIIDADLFYDELLCEILDQEVVLTPHPKEFCSLLKFCEIADISVEELQNNRFLYVRKFSEKYPAVVLLLKGANVIISQGEKVFVNSFGSAVLSKGGSGDVLSGLIGSLLAQGYKPLDATITASLAHTIAARNYSKNNYSLIPSDLVEEVRKL